MIDGIANHVQVEATLGTWHRARLKGDKLEVVKKKKQRKAKMKGRNDIDTNLASGRRNMSNKFDLVRADVGNMRTHL